jgi:hypothetical protein
MTKRLALLVLVLTAACNGATTTTVSAPTSPSPAATKGPLTSTATNTALHHTPTASPTASATQAAKPKPVAPVYTGVHFRTPEGAMRYLARAWNEGNLTRLKHVTDPTARQLLLNMHREAANLKLKSCTSDPHASSFSCEFTHDYPTGYQHTEPIGYFWATVGPAANPGWYMTYYESCG